jgi:hypothetical protein
MLDAGAFNRIFVRVQPRCLPAVSGGRGLVGCDRYVVVTVFGRDVCLNCQVAATMLDAGAMIRFFVRVLPRCLSAVSGGRGDVGRDR